MRLYNRVRLKEEREVLDTTTKDFSHSCIRAKKVRSVLLLTSFVIFGGLFFLMDCIKKDLKEESSIEVSQVHMVATPVAATASNRGVIDIPAGVVKANPFVPYRDLSANSKVYDVPDYELVEPPVKLNESSDAARVMDAIVSGILYDKYSPSAILNIEGNDYLVKKDDVINNYQVLNISQDAVTVKLGVNVYKAGIGEILTEGTLNHNNVSNLNNKFGGNDNEIQ